MEAASDTMPVAMTMQKYAGDSAASPAPGGGAVVAV